MIAITYLIGHVEERRELRKLRLLSCHYDCKRSGCFLCEAYIDRAFLYCVSTSRVDHYNCYPSEEDARADNRLLGVVYIRNLSMEWPLAKVEYAAPILVEFTNFSFI